LGFLAYQNYDDYFIRFPTLKPSRQGMGQAIFVQEMNKRVTSQGRPTPKYFNLAPEIAFWSYETNAFLNHDTLGEDLLSNLSELPNINNQGRDAVFMVGRAQIALLPQIEALYPGGEEGTFSFGPYPDPKDNYLYSYYWVKKEIIE